MDTSGSCPVAVRRAGPQPRMVTNPTSVLHPPASAVPMDGAGAGAGTGPAPTAPASLAAQIQQALETPLTHNAFPPTAPPLSVDPPTDAPPALLGQPFDGAAAPRSVSSGDASNGSTGRDGARSSASGLSLALALQQADYFGDDPLPGSATQQQRHAAIAAVHNQAVASNASAAAALFGDGGGDVPADSGRGSGASPHLISAVPSTSRVLPRRGLGGGSAAAAAAAAGAGRSQDEPPPPASSPRGSIPDTRRSSTDGSLWGAQDAAWLDSHLGAAAQPPLGNKVAFDASRPNIVASDDDNE